MTIFRRFVSCVFLIACNNEPVANKYKGINTNEKPEILSTNQECINLASAFTLTILDMPDKVLPTNFNLISESGKFKMEMHLADGSILENYANAKEAINELYIGAEFKDGKFQAGINVYDALIEGKISLQDLKLDEFKRKHKDILTKNLNNRSARLPYFSNNYSKLINKIPYNICSNSLEAIFIEDGKFKMQYTKDK